MQVACRSHAGLREVSSLYERCGKRHRRDSRCAWTRMGRGISGDAPPLARCPTSPTPPFNTERVKRENEECSGGERALQHHRAQAIAPCNIQHPTDHATCILVQHHNIACSHDKIERVHGGMEGRREGGRRASRDTYTDSLSSTDSLSPSRPAA